MLVCIICVGLSTRHSLWEWGSAAVDPWGPVTLRRGEVSAPRAETMGSGATCGRHGNRHSQGQRTGKDIYRCLHSVFTKCITSVHGFKKIWSCNFTVPTVARFCTEDTRCVMMWRRKANLSTVVLCDLMEPSPHHRLKANAIWQCSLSSPLSLRRSMSLWNVTSMLRRLWEDYTLMLKFLMVRIWVWSLLSVSFLSFTLSFISWLYHCKTFFTS